MPTWLITGCSSGLGRHLAQAVLAHGWNAVVTARNSEKVQDIAARYSLPILCVLLCTSVASVTHCRSGCIASRSSYGGIGAAALPQTGRNF